MKRLKRFFPTSFRRGSVLAYTLILLSVVLLAAIGIATVSITNERSALLSNRSVSSFQVADTGSQAAVAEIRNTLSNGGTQLSDLTVAGGSCSNAGGFAAISSNNSGTVGDYTLTFYDKDENQLRCSDNLSQIATVKSVGVYRDTSRAVKVALAAGACPVTGGLVLADSSNDENGYDYGKILSYLNDGARIVEGRCGINPSNPMKSYSGDYMYISITSTLSMSTTDGQGGMACSTTAGTCKGSFNPFSTPADCSQGWRIYVECPVL